MCESIGPDWNKYYFISIPTEKILQYTMELVQSDT